MAKKLYEESSIQAIATAIREKNGTTTKYKVAEMGAAVMALPSKDNITQSDIPSYVKAEALAVAEKVKAVLQNDSIVFLAIADLSTRILVRSLPVSMRTVSSLTDKTRPIMPPVVTTSSAT